jgi:competence protein ComEA
MKRLIWGILLPFLLSFGAWAAVDINTATQSELESVKGIGPAKAKAIMEYRQKQGPFKHLEDLANVRGFGKASLRKLEGELSVGDAADGTRAGMH